MTRLVRALLALVVGAVGVAACGEQSRVDPNARVQVQGVVRDVDGAPLDGRPVRLGSGVSDLEGGFGVMTVGMFCLTGGCTGEFFDTTTGDDGRYRFELSGAATRSSFGEAVSFLLSTSAEPAGAHPSGPAVAARFRVQAADLVLPELQLMDPGLELAGEGREVLARWELSAAPGPYTVGFVTADDVPGWEVTTTADEVHLDGRVLEDLRGRAIVGGERTDHVEGSEVTILWQSSSVAFQGGTGAPPSRGAACTVLAADGTRESMPGGCGLTDGTMTPAGAPGVVCPVSGDAPPTGGCPAADRVRVELPGPVPAELVVVRGCRDTCPVWVIHDGAAGPVHAGTVSGPFGTVSLDGAPVTAVDVQSEEWLSDLAEVSVWGPVADGEAALRSVTDPQSVEVDSWLGSGDDGGRRWSVIVFAAVAIVLVGAGAMLGRRMAR